MSVAHPLYIIKFCIARIPNDFIILGIIIVNQQVYSSRMVFEVFSFPFQEFTNCKYLCVTDLFVPTATSCSELARGERWCIFLLIWNNPTLEEKVEEN